MDDDDNANETEQFFNLVPNTTYEIFRDPTSSPHSGRNGINRGYSYEEAPAMRKPPNR